MAPGQQQDEEDDYMNMVFDDPTPAKESSFQRAQRLKKESRARGVIKSKAQLAEEEAAARDKALSTSLLDDPARARKSKGLAMMAKMGFSGGGLGKRAEDGSVGGSGRTEPISIQVKENRGGIGLDAEKKRKLREAAEERGVKSVRLDPDGYRERVRKEREDARIEKQLHAAQRLAERLDDENPAVESEPSARTAGTDADASAAAAVPISSRPLKSIPVIYRGLFRHRAEVERDRRMRHDLEQSLSRLPTYEDDEEDEDDKKALGKTRVVYAHIEDLEDDDEELDEFNALELAERLRQLLEHLRSRHHYCFWCKSAYPTSDMDGCPGLLEEDHD